MGAYLLRYAHGDDACGRVLDYLVRLTKQIRVEGEWLPGWWTRQQPYFTSPEVPGGHANLGLAHGITGPLALLALALRAGVVVDGQREAIERVLAWLDRWQQHDTYGVWWPQWITRDEYRTGRARQPAPGRPSWCYGIPGITRAQQLAAIAIGDLTRQQRAETTLVDCLLHPDHLGRLEDASVCHGWAGLLLTTWRAADDAATPALHHRLPHLMSQVIEHATHIPTSGDSLLEGQVGMALVLDTIAQHTPPRSGWDACLLIT